jgi:hypothetical protein
MGVLKMVLIFVGVVLVGFLVASIAFFGDHAFLLWVAVILLIVYAISGLVAARRAR